MATFEVKIYKLTIEPHTNADSLELAVIGNYRAIVAKGMYKTGDLAAYIPEDAIVPAWLITKLNLDGRLAGKRKNRVKAIKLRGALSQGLIVPLIGDASTTFPDACTFGIENETDTMGVVEGDDVTEFLGIKKYEPIIPACMNGENFIARGCTLKYDIENIKKYPNIFQAGEEISITEKIHGTWSCFGYHPEADGLAVVSSKGLSAQGVALKVNEENKNNLYVSMFNALGGLPFIKLVLAAVQRYQLCEAVYIVGETFGAGVQDLGYGSQSPSFRVFDIYVGFPSKGRYLNHDEVQDIVTTFKLDAVPLLYKGPYSIDIVNQFTDGKETVSGTEANIREGIVIRPTIERTDNMIGRVMLKSISEKYLLRKNATEFT